MVLGSSWRRKLRNELQRAGRAIRARPEQSINVMCGAFASIVVAPLLYVVGAVLAI